MDRLTRRQELLAQLEDARGESAFCGDDECSCHKVPAQIQDELDELDEEAR